MDENDCCTLHFEIYRLQLTLLQHQDDSLATDHHSEVVNSSTNNTQCVLHHGVVQQWHQHFITFTWFSIACNAICGCGTFLTSAMVLEILWNLNMRWKYYMYIELVCIWILYWFSVSIPISGVLLHNLELL